MKKIKVVLAGGLGNQIFQYSAGRRFAEKLNKELTINTARAANSHSSFNISSFSLNAKIRNAQMAFLIGRLLPITNHLWDKWLHINRHHLIDQNYEGNCAHLEVSEVKSISGFFQDMRYLSRSDLADFKLTNPSAGYNSYRSLFEDHFIIGVHVRRGDFVGQSESHGCLSAEWYLTQIIRSIEVNRPDSMIVIFTDDRNWVSDKICSALSKDLSVNVISKDDLEDPAESWDLLRSADYLICSNSTFSITAAFYSDCQIVLPMPLTRKVNFEDIETSLPGTWLRATAIWEL